MGCPSTAPPFTGAMTQSPRCVWRCARHCEIGDARDGERGLRLAPASITEGQRKPSWVLRGTSEEEDRPSAFGKRGEHCMEKTLRSEQTSVRWSGREGRGIPDGLVHSFSQASIPQTLVAQPLHPGLLARVEGEINRYRVFWKMLGSPACLYSTECE